MLGFTSLRTACTLAILICLPSAYAFAETIWQIGSADRDYRDLTWPGSVAAYREAFPKDVSFTVGKSDPKNAFSAIQPGPTDEWGWFAEHPFRIAFDLPAEPTGTYELDLHVLDTHGGIPPILRVTVNGQKTEVAFDRGTGELTLVRPEMGKTRTVRLFLRADQLKRTGNQIELRIVKGSWILYDAITLQAIAPGASPPVEITVRPSIFFVERDGQLLQECTLSATGFLADEAVTVEAGGPDKSTERFSLDKPSLAAVSGNIHLKDTDKPRELTVRVSGGNQRGQVQFTQQPQRKWRIYVAPSVHTDIGYTDLQDEVIRIHNRNTDLALEMAGRFPLYHFNLESSWAAQLWLQQRPAWMHERLFQAARDRRVGIESGYLNLLTGLCSEEELIRNLYYSARLQREHGIPFESHTITDSPSHVWTVPSILAGAGLNCISVGINSIRAPILKQNIHHKSPFWWEGPDGRRVMTWFADHYGQAAWIGLTEDADRMPVVIEYRLWWWDHRSDYPYDAILLHGAYQDNRPIGRNMADCITEYSKRYAYPKVILSANNDFFDYIQKHFADQVPTVRGCGGSWWEDGAASSAVETAINRGSHQTIVAAETAWASLAAADTTRKYPRDGFDRAWDDILLYDEHTWGAHNSITQPTSDFVQRQWAYKAAFATRGADRANRLLNDALEALAGRVDAPPGSLVVFNASGRDRTGAVRATLKAGTRIMDGDTAVPQQVVETDVWGNATVTFVAGDVPACGYRTYRVAPGPAEAAPAPAALSGNVLENRFYRVTFDPTTGGLASLVDKRRNCELVDAKSPYKLGQFIYAAGGGSGRDWDWPQPKLVQRHSPTQAKVETGTVGPVYRSARSIAATKMMPSIELEVMLYEQEPRVDFIYRLRKEMTYEREAAYIAFPIAGANPHFRYEVGGGSARPNEDQFPGACRDWFAVQRGVTVTTDAGAVAWSPVDSPLVTLCDMWPGHWLDKLPITNGTIFAYVMNNYWGTNYKAGQDGNMVFRYALTSGQSIEPAEASRFGQSVHAPLRAVLIPPAAEGPKLPTSNSFCRVEPANAELTTFKQADDGKGFIVRVRETAGRDTDVRITIGCERLTKASRCDLVERARESIPMEKNTVSFRLGHNGMETIRLE